MARNPKIEKIKLVSEESSYFYTTQINKANRADKGKLVLRKYDPLLKKHVNFKQEKIK